MKILGWELVKKPGGNRVLRRVPRRRTTGIPAIMRTGFKAAEGGLLYSGWGKEPIPINEHLKNELMTVRARSRSESLNNPYHSRFLSLARNNVVGANGIVLQSRVKNRDGTPDKPAREAIEAAWAAQCLPENCTMSGNLDMIAAQNTHISTVAGDGETLWMAVEGKSAGPTSFALHQVDVDLLDVHLNQDQGNGNRIRMGIETNEWNRPIAYYLKASVHGEHPWIAKSGKPYTRIPAEAMFHDFLRERPNQLRGIPWAASTLARSRMLDAYDEAAVVAARVGAAKVGVIKSDEEYTGEEIEPATGDVIMDADPGSWFNLDVGQSIDSWNPDYPHAQYPAFTKTAGQNIAMGYGVDYPSLSGNLEAVNFSSIRAGVLETREGWKTLQGWMSRGFLTWVFRRWLLNQLLQERILINGKKGLKPLSLDYLDKYERVLWQGRRWAWVDPLKDSQSAKIAVENKWRSDSEVIRDMTGRDSTDVWDECESDAKEKAKRNIVVDADVAPLIKEDPDDGE